MMRSALSGPRHGRYGRPGVARQDLRHGCGMNRRVHARPFERNAREVRSLNRYPAAPRLVGKHQPVGRRDVSGARLQNYNVAGTGGVERGLEVSACRNADPASAGKHVCRVEIDSRQFGTAECLGLGDIADDRDRALMKFARKYYCCKDQTGCQPVPFHTRLPYFSSPEWVEGGYVLWRQSSWAELRSTQINPELIRIAL